MPGPFFNRNLMNLLAVIVLLYGLPNWGFSQLENLKKEVGKIIRYDTEIDFDLVPGSVIAVLDQDSTFIFNIGKEEYTSVLNGSSIFEIGSISKLFTAHVVWDLIHHGYFQEDSKINELLPPSVRNPRMSHLTISSLLNHQSGFPRIPTMFGSKQKKIQDPYAHYSKSDLLEYYRDYVPQNGRIESYSYSHIGYALLEIIVEQETGKLFEEVLRERIFNPADMTHTFITFPEMKNITKGHNLAMRKAGPWHFLSFAGAEGIKSTANDLAKYLHYLFNNLWDNDPTNLSYWMQPVTKTDLNNKIMIGNGWHILNQNNKYDIYTHTGKTSGHSATLALVKETKTAVIILSNSVHSTKELGYLILRMINDNWNRKL